MELGSITGLPSSGSTQTKVMGQGKNMDAFSELFAMLFANMLMPSNNPYSLLVSQANLNTSNITQNSSINETQALSVLEYMRSGLGQFKGSEEDKSVSAFNSLIGSMLGNNIDLKSLFNSESDVSPELIEFISSIKDRSDETVADIAVQAAVEDDMAAAEAKTLSGLYEINTETKRADQELGVEPEEVFLDAANRETNIIKEENSDKISKEELIKLDADTYNKKEGISEAVNIQKSSEDIRPEDKTEKLPEQDNNIKMAGNISNLNVRDIDRIIPEPKELKAALVKSPHDIIDIAVEKFKTLKLPGFTEVTVKLKPEDLGEISLKLVLEKGQINGSITADRKEVAVMLQNNLDQLRSDLKDNNVNLNHLSVNIQSGEDFNRNNNQSGFARKGNRNSNKIVQAFEEEIQATDPMEGLNIIA